MENKETSIEQLVKQIRILGNNVPVTFEKQAEEMHKQEIIDAITIGFEEGRLYMHNGTTKYETGLEYYKETYGK